MTLSRSPRRACLALQGWLCRLISPCLRRSPVIVSFSFEVKSGIHTRMPNVRDKTSFSFAANLSRSSEVIETVEVISLAHKHNCVEVMPAL
jgi:hypothetical protein